MKKHLFIFIVFIALVLPRETVAQCSCYYQNTLRSAGYYGNNDFNCYQYVRATFDGNHYGEWIPPYNNSIQYNYSSAVISEANDPGDFEEVCDPEDANVVVYPCGHAAVIVNSAGCLIEKVGYGSSLRKYGLNYGSCSISSNTKYYKYLGSWVYEGLDIGLCGYSVDCGPPQTDCNNQAVWYNTSTVLNTFNFTSNYFNQIWADCNDATSFSWTKVSGNDVYHNTFSGGQGFYFYLNNGQSVTYNLTAFLNSSTLFTKNYTFYRSGGYYMADDNSGEAELLNHRQNEITNNSDQELEVEIFSVDGRRLNGFKLSGYNSEMIQARETGIYLLVIKNKNELLETKRVFLTDN